MNNNIDSNINPNTPSLINNISNNKMSEKKNKDTTIKVSLEVKKIFDEVAEKLKNENPKLNTNSLVVEDLIRKYNEAVFGEVELDAMSEKELQDYEFYNIIDGVEILELYNSKPIQNINIVILELLSSREKASGDDKAKINKLLNYIKASYEEYMKATLTILSNFGHNIYILHKPNEYKDMKDKIIAEKRKANSKETAKRAMESLKEAMASDDGNAFIDALDYDEGIKLLEKLREKYEVGDTNTTQKSPTGIIETPTQPSQLSTDETETSTDSPTGGTETLAQSPTDETETSTDSPTNEMKIFTDPLIDDIDFSGIDFSDMNTYNDMDIFGLDETPKEISFDDDDFDIK